MRRWPRLTAPLAAAVPVPVAALLIVLHARPATAALVLLVSTLTAAGLGGGGAGVAAALISTFVFGVNILPPRNLLRLTDAGGIELLVFAAVEAAVVFGAVLMRRAGVRARDARTAAERRSSVLAGQVAMIAPVLDDSPVGFAVFDTELRYRYLNRTQAAMHGSDAAAHVGRRFAEVFPDHVDLLEPYVMEVLRTGESQLDQVVEGPGGRLFRVDRYPVRDAAGAVSGVALAVQDITARQRLTELQAEADRLRATANLVSNWRRRSASPGSAAGRSTSPPGWPASPGSSTR